jgi:hypothetical protein
MGKTTLAIASQDTSARAAIKKRGRHNSNIWIFHSPKIDRRLVIRGDIAFMHLVLVEGNPQIRSYHHESPTVHAHDGKEVRQTTYDMRVLFADGHPERWEFKHSRNLEREKAQLAAQAADAQTAGERYRILTERDLQGKGLLFDNWLVLCGAMNRCRRYPLTTVIDLVNKLLAINGALSLGDLMAQPGQDSALVMAAVARGLQRGIYSAPLQTELCTSTTKISHASALTQRRAA